MMISIDGFENGTFDIKVEFKDEAEAALFANPDNPQKIPMDQFLEMVSGGRVPAESLMKALNAKNIWVGFKQSLSIAKKNGEKRENVYARRRREIAKLDSEEERAQMLHDLRLDMDAVFGK